MGKPVDVDVDALRVLGTSLAGEADRITGLDPTAAIGDAASTMPGSAVGAAASRAGAPLLDAYRARAGALSEMAVAAHSTADGYADTDETFRAGLATAGGGL